MLTKSERSYFKVAKAISELSDYPQHHLGCVIVNKHRIISSGYNSKTKYNPIQAKLDTERYGVCCLGSLHAESAAIIPLLKCKEDLSKAAIYVFRSHKNGKNALAKPCPSCQKLIRLSGIKKVYYTTEGGWASERIN